MKQMIWFISLPEDVLMDSVDTVHAHNTFTLPSHAEGLPARHVKSQSEKSSGPAKLRLRYAKRQPTYRKKNIYSQIFALKRICYEARILGRLAEAEWSPDPSGLNRIVMQVALALVERMCVNVQSEIIGE